MTAIQQAEIAIHNLILAKLHNNHKAILKWQCWVDYWSEVVRQENLYKSKGVK